MSAVKQQNDREEFLGERRKYLGATDIAAVLGVDPYKTPLDVYNEKLGLVESFKGNAQTERGQKLEAIAAQEYTEQTGRKLHRRRMEVVHPKYDFIRAHLDRRVVGGDKRPVEIKCPSRGMFYKVKREGLIDSWIVQMQVQLWLDRSPLGEWAVFCSDVWDLIPFPVEAQPEMYEQIEHAAVIFWTENVLKRVPPAALDADKPKLEFAKSAGEVTQIEDPAFIESAELLREAKQLELDGKQLYEIAKQRIIQSVGGRFGKYQGGGLRLSYYQSPGHTSFDKRTLKAEHPEIKLELYEKRGDSFPVFKPFWINHED